MDAYADSLADLNDYQQEKSDADDQCPFDQGKRSNTEQVAQAGDEEGN
jgi:hypothetical protein